MCAKCEHANLYRKMKTWIELRVSGTPILIPVGDLKLLHNALRNDMINHGWKDLVDDKKAD